MSMRLRLVTLFLCVLAAVTAGSQVVLAGRPTALPFSFRYRIKFLIHPAGLSVGTSLLRINAEGIAFGGGGNGCNLYLIDADTGDVCWDVRELISPPLGSGISFSAAAISDKGKLAGTMYLPDGSRRACVIDTHNSLIPGDSTVTVVSDASLPGVSSSLGYGVNDSGELLGVYCDELTGTPHLFLYDMNAETSLRFDGTDVPDLPISGTNDLRFMPQLNRVGQVAGQLQTIGEGFRFTPGDNPTVEYFPSSGAPMISYVNSLNDLGVVAGTMEAPKAIKGYFFCPYRCYPGENIPRPLTNIGTYSIHDVRINSSGDLKVLHQGMDPAIYHESSKYFFIVEDLVVFDEVDRTLWESRDLYSGFSISEMTDRVPGSSAMTPPLEKQVGRLCGSIGFDKAQSQNQATPWIGVVLTPEYPPFSR